MTLGTMIVTKKIHIHKMGAHILSLYESCVYKSDESDNVDHDMFDVKKRDMGGGLLVTMNIMVRLIVTKKQIQNSIGNCHGHYCVCDFNHSMVSRIVIISTFI